MSQLGIRCACDSWCRGYGAGRPGEEHHRDCKHWCERVGEAYVTKTELIVLGDPGDDENHNCDAMGCGTFSHVLYRMPRPAGVSGTPRSERLEQLLRMHDEAVRALAAWLPEHRTPLGPLVTRADEAKAAIHALLADGVMASVPQSIDDAIRAMPRYVTPLMEEPAPGVEGRDRPLGCVLAMRVMQSDLYQQLDDTERANCDELVRRNLEWFKADAAAGVRGTFNEQEKRDAPDAA